MSAPHSVTIPDVIPLPACPEGEIALVAIAIQHPKCRPALETDTESDDFSRPLVLKLRDILLDRIREGAPIGITALEKTWPTGEDPPAAVQGVFEELRDFVPMLEHWPWYLGQVKKATVQRRIMRRAEKLLRIAGNGAEPREIQEVTAALQRDASAFLEVESPAPRLQAITAAGYDPNEKIPVEYGTADGEILCARGDLILIPGEVGAGKSVFTLEACRARSRGESLFGFPCEKGKALFLTSDGDGPGPVRKRLARLLLGAGETVADMDAPGLQVFAPESFCLDTPADLEALARLLQEHDPDLVGLDSLNSLMRPDREAYSAAGVGDFIRTALRPLQIRPDGTRRTILVTHHLRKRQPGPGGNALKDRISGSYYTLGGVDAAIGLEAIGAETFNVRMVKRSRWGAAFAAFLARIEGGPEDPLKLANLGPLKPSSAERTADENALLESISALVRIAGSEAWIALADAKTRQGIKREDAKLQKRMDRAADRLQKAGRLERRPNGKRLYRIPVGAPDREDSDE